MNERMPYLHQKSNDLPLSPGVYIMRNKKKEIIYIGKAKILKNRVSQYFSNKQHDVKVGKMVENVYDFDYILTDSEFEALILEASLIKQHMPKYNILLKDDKGYHYFRITNQKYRRIEAVHRKDDDNCTYIGPYNSSFIVTKTLEEARKTFKLPACKKDFEKEFTKRPCLNYHIGLCMAPCCRKVGLAEYNEAFNEALDFINNGAIESVKVLTDKMNKAAENLEFEKAAKLRDKIAAIKSVKEKQKVTSMKVKEQDVIAVATGDNKICFEIFRFEKGRLFDNQHFISELYSDKENALSDFIMQYYSSDNFIPSQITLSINIEDGDAVSKALAERKGKSVKIIVPQKGELKKLCDMCENNAIEHLFEKSAGRYKNKRPLAELSDLLGLKTIPGRIESYDISNTAGSENVAGMVVYKNGEKSPSDYRKFKIKSFIGQDDVRSMSEVIERRFLEYLDEKSTDSSFKELPDLILVDGGKTQVSAAKSVLQEKGISVPIFGMVKDSKHRTRAIMSDEGEVELKATKSAFMFVTALQDEVHRYAITFHKSRRKRTSLESSLMSIDGVGEKRATALFNHFKTISAIKNATIEDIKSVKGIDSLTAQNIFNFFNS